MLLRTVADRLRGCLRPADTAARLGGDEFVDPAQRADRPASASARVVDRIRTQLDVPVILGEGVVATVGASIGVALGDAETPDADTLVRQLRHRHVRRQARGRHDFVVYEPDMGDTTVSPQGHRGRAGRGDPQRRADARSTSR